MFMFPGTAACRLVPAQCTRFVSQFKIPQTDCLRYAPVRRVVNPQVCKARDTGLVLGVYYNEHVDGERAVLTATAERFDRAANGRLWQLLQIAPIPRLGEVRVFFDVDSRFGYVAVAGLGSECLAYSKSEKRDESKEAIRVAAGVGARALKALNPSSIHLESFGNAEAAAEGAALSIWQFREYKTITKLPTLKRSKLYLHDDCDFEGWKLGQAKADSQNLARFLQEMPANLLNPTEFAKIAVDLLCELDINVEIRTKGWAACHEMGGFVSIGKSSVQPPLYVELSYYGADQATRPVVLIGKGITFDSGSLELKAPDELRYMKGDMAGAACVLAVTRAAAMLKLPVNLRAILPLCELLPGGKSPKYGDIVNSALDKTIQLRLPSREGRLLLADSLAYARTYWPKFMLDVGTMSKELLESLGGSACGCYSNSEELFGYLELASSETGDRVWRMPLWKFYEDRVLDCQIADVANVGEQLYGDSPNCAAFLRQFVCDTRWMHLDTYNVSYTKGVDVPYLARGMTGRPTRTLIELLYQLLADRKL